MWYQWDLLVFAGAFGVVVFTPGPAIAAMVGMVLAKGRRPAVVLGLAADKGPI